MGRWSDLKKKQSKGTSNYITPGSYVLSLAMFKNAKPGTRDEVFVIEADVVEVISEVSIPMRGKDMKESVMTHSKGVDERISIVWTVGKSKWPDTLLGEVANSAASILGMTENEREDCPDDEWEEGMDSLVENNGEDFIGTKFVCHVSRKAAKEGGHHFCTHAFEPAPDE